MNLRRKAALINALVLLTIYSAMGLVMMAAESFHLWSVRFLALIPMTILLDHLLILQHEGSHFLIHPKRATNDLITNLLCSFPLLGSVSQYRYFHADHHRHLQDTELDPEIGFYAEQGYFFKAQSLPKVFGILFLDLCGYHYLNYFYSYYSYVIREVRAQRMPGMRKSTLFSLLLFVLTIGGLIAHFGPIILFYWLLPQPTLFFFLTKLAGYGEHTGLTGSIEASTYQHRFHGWQRVLIYPLNSDLHLEHHLQPHLPWFKLRSAIASPSSAPVIQQLFIGKQSIIGKMIS